MAGLKETSEKDAHWSTWAAALSDWRDVLRTVESQVEALVEPEVREATKYERRALESSRGRVAVWEERIQAGLTSDLAQRELGSMKSEAEAAESALAIAEDRARATMRMELRAHFSDNDRRTVTGSADELIEYIETRRFRSMTFEVPSGYRRGRQIRLTTNVTEGIDLHVQADDAKWTDAAFLQVSESVRRGIPRWRLIRAFWLLWAFYALCISTALTLITSKLYTVLKFSAAEQIETYFSVLVIFGLLITGAVVLTRRLIPAFEILRPGQRSRGGAALAILASGVATIVLGVVVNRIS